MRFNPSCACCCQYADQFNRSNSTDLGASWDERSGNWEIASNELKGTGAGRIIWNTAQAGGHSCSIQLGSLLALGQRFRLILGYVDDSNYVAAELSMNTGFATGDGWIAIIERVAGVETARKLIGPADYGGQLNACYRPVAGAVPASLTIRTGNPGVTGGQYWYKDLAVDPGGDKVGVEIISGTCSFDNFGFPKAVSGSGSALTCFDPTILDCGGQTLFYGNIGEIMHEVLNYAYNTYGLFHIYVIAHNRGLANLKWKLSSNVFGASPSVGRVIIGWKDANNYIYGEFSVPFAAGNTISISAKLGQVAAGVDTIIAGPNVVASVKSTATWLGTYVICNTDGSCTFTVSDNNGASTAAAGAVTPDADSYGMGDRIIAGAVIDPASAFGTAEAGNPHDVNCVTC